MARASAAASAGGTRSLLCGPKISGMPPTFVVISGTLAAAASSTMGDEKRTNPYLRVSRLDDFLTFLGV